MSELRKVLREEAEAKLTKMTVRLRKRAHDECANTSVDAGLLLKIVSGKRTDTLVKKAIAALANDAEAELLKMRGKPEKAPVAMASPSEVNAKG